MDHPVKVNRRSEYTFEGSALLVSSRNRRGIPVSQLHYCGSRKRCLRLIASRDADTVVGEANQGRSVGYLSEGAARAL